MATVQRNESAASFAWLWERLGEPSREPWNAIRGQMLGVRGAFSYLQDWVPDFWMARGSRRAGALLVPSWDPPESVDEWPTLGVEGIRGLLSARTAHSAFMGVMQENSAAVKSDRRVALEEFMRAESEIERPGDARMVRGEYVRAWLSAALGNLLMSIALTPPDDLEALIQTTVNRMMMPRQFELPPQWANEFEERRLALLYNARVMQDESLQVSSMRVGQGETWREHWGWLSTEVSVADALEGLRVGARLMRCDELVVGLMWSLQESDDEYRKTVALAVVRRWFLTLKVMAWLETALQHTWEAARPQDLACFAFNALKPEWPRRMLGISHRSADVKVALMKMKVWGNSHVAIDANYVPAWETNTGMMWGLFASSPVLARIVSPRYLESVWCYREHEIIQYLLDHGDYMEERWVNDVTEENMVVLDDLLGDSVKEDSLSSFPPLCTVWGPRLMPEWEVKMMRAAGALRIANLFSENRPEGVNRLAAALAGGLQLPGTGPTNNPGGWEGYARIFADVRALTGVASEQLPLRLPLNYGKEESGVDSMLSDRIPDLGSGMPRLEDVLVAFEWYRVVWPVMVEQGRGDFLVINCQRWTAEQWITHERLSLFRGLAAMRAPVPMWFLQLAGQDVENWPLVGNRPIFTEHVSSQFGWMMEISLGPEAQERYPSDSGLEFSDELAAMCANGGTVRREA